MVRRARPGEDGFTLVELMVVVVVVAALLAVAIPSMLTARGRAEDRAAQGRLRTGYAAEKLHYLGQTNGATYTADPAALSALEPSVAFEPGAPAESDRVYVTLSAGSPATLYLAAKSTSGRCWYLRQNPLLGTVDFAGDPACPAPSDALTWRGRW